MTTSSKKPVSRVTDDKYKFAVYGAYRHDAGRQIVATIDGTMLTLREKNSRKRWSRQLCDLLNQWMKDSKPDDERTTEE